MISRIVFFSIFTFILIFLASCKDPIIVTTEEEDLTELIDLPEVLCNDYYLPCMRYKEYYYERISEDTVKKRSHFEFDSQGRVKFRYSNSTGNDVDIIKSEYFYVDDFPLPNSVFFYHDDILVSILEFEVSYEDTLILSENYLGISGEADCNPDKTYIYNEQNRIQFTTRCFKLGDTRFINIREEYFYTDGNVDSIRIETTEEGTDYYQLDVEHFRYTNIIAPIDYHYFQLGIVNILGFNNSENLVLSRYKIYDSLGEGRVTEYEYEIDDLGRITMANISGQWSFENFEY